MDEKQSQPQEEKNVISRREALAKLGRFSAYSAPVVTTIISPRAIAHNFSGGGPYPNFSTCVAEGGHTNHCTATNGNNHGDEY